MGAARGMAISGARGSMQLVAETTEAEEGTEGAEEDSATVETFPSGELCSRER